MSLNRSFPSLSQSADAIHRFGQVRNEEEEEEERSSYSLSSMGCFLLLFLSDWWGINTNTLDGQSTNGKDPTGTDLRVLGREHEGHFSSGCLLTKEVTVTRLGSGDNIESAIGGGANGIHTEHSPILPRTANFVHCHAMNERETLFKVNRSNSFYKLENRQTDSASASGRSSLMIPDPGRMRWTWKLFTKHSVMLSDPRGKSLRLLHFSAGQKSGNFLRDAVKEKVASYRKKKKIWIRKRGSAPVPTVTALDNSKPGCQLCSPKSSAYLGDRRQFSVDWTRSLPNQLQSFLGVGKVKWGHPSPLSALPWAIDIIRQAYLKMCFRAHISKFQRNAFLTVRTSVPEAKKEEQEQEAFIHVMAKDFADRARLGLVLRFDKRKAKTGARIALHYETKETRTETVSQKKGAFAHSMVEHQPAWKDKSRQRPSCRGMKEVAFLEKEYEEVKS
ncbi:hypothetical protein L1987_24101 [Smallanthus sonchifolius]|uniref:Uncharacterized protein n=1 Tax=Smallanthus sonchifolius TaxID=185202 RepID=A0ACB9IJJ1_9ASTR|nr:hypothetical protein L1987_24101 [Smallanthus sonchifolius]